MGGTRFVAIPGRHHRFIDAPPDLIGMLSRLGQH